jgi:hypothetical protein
MLRKKILYKEGKYNNNFFHAILNKRHHQKWDVADRKGLKVLVRWREEDAHVFDYVCGSYCIISLAGIG